MLWTVLQFSPMTHVEWFESNGEIWFGTTNYSVAESNHASSFNMSCIWFKCGLSYGLSYGLNMVCSMVCVIFCNIYKQQFDSCNISDWCFLLVVALPVAKSFDALENMVLLIFKFKVCESVTP